MLTDRTIRDINSQIRDELRTVDSSIPSHDEKMAALERIAKLKEILEPTQAETPSRQTIIKELASAIIEAREETRERNRPVDFFEAIFGIRR